MMFRCSINQLCRIACFMVLALTAPLGATAAMAQEVYASVLPQGRFGRVGVPVTAFATILNNTNRQLTGCGIALSSQIPATLGYFRTNVQNVIVGGRNQPATIAARQSQGFVFELVANAPINSQEVQLDFRCTGAGPAPVFVGVNTFLFGASTQPTVDILAINAVLSNDGIANIPGIAPPATGIMSVAAVNLASTADATLRVVPALSNGNIPADLFVCQTNPTTGQCLQPPAQSVNARIAKSGENPRESTFTVFIRSRGTIPFNPAQSRVNLRFLDVGNAVRGGTSAALQTRNLVGTDNNGNGRWDDVEDFSALVLNAMLPNGGARNPQLGRLQIISQDGILRSDLTDQSIEYARLALVQIACLRLEQRNMVNVGRMASSLGISLQSNPDRARMISQAGRRSGAATFRLPQVTAADCAN